MTKKIAQSIQFFSGQRVLKQGMVQKKSDWLRAWRSRKIVLFQNRLAFYNEQLMNQQPTIELFLRQISTIKSKDDHNSKMIIQSSRGQYEVNFKTCQQKQEWKQSISQAVRNYKIKRSQIFGLNRPNSKRDQDVRECNLLCF